MDKVRGFEIVHDELRVHKDIKIKLPTRGSLFSAGYDIRTPIKFEVKPNELIQLYTDIKVYMQAGEVLNIYMRSSTAITKGLILANGTGIIDADYYSNLNNDGNIILALFNHTEKLIKIEEYERIAQGIFTPFLIADYGNIDIVRNGGIGSTFDYS